MFVHLEIIAFIRKFQLAVEIKLEFRYSYG